MNLPPKVAQTLRRRLHFLKGRDYVNSFDDAEISALTQVLSHFEQDAPMTRRVVCAVLRQNDEIIPGVRHFDEDMLVALGDEDWSKAEQGFIDNRGHFLTREEAWIVAEEAGQILRRVPGDGQKLFSENLY